MTTIEEHTNFLSSDSEQEVASTETKTITKVSRMVNMDAPRQKKYTKIATENIDQPPNIELVIFINRIWI